MMSVHSYIQSRFTSLRDVQTALRAAGYKWKMLTGVFKKTPVAVATGRPIIHGLKAQIGDDLVLIIQFNSDSPFVFESPDGGFLNMKTSLDLATPSWEVGNQTLIQQNSGERQNWQGEPSRTDQDPTGANSRRLAEENSTALTAEMQWLEQRKLRIAAERQRTVREQTIPTKSPATQTDSSDLTQGNIVKRADPPTGDPSVNVIPLKQLNQLLQQNAQSKVLESLSEIEEKFGITLSDQWVEADGTITLTLNG